MSGKKQKTIDRRSFVGTSVKLVTLGTLLIPIAEACNNKKSSNTGSPGSRIDKKGTTGSLKKSRKKWNYESLVMNTKTMVLHYPTIRLYHYYDEIKSSHLQKINRNAWNPEAENAPRLNKQQSGNILEILTLQELGKGISDSTLIIAIDTLSIAFLGEYEKENTTNFRLHELMLQLITLNSLIPPDQKWETFKANVKKPVQLRKRQKWMETESGFNERVKYIMDRQAEYKSRLSVRAKKYSYI